jgi:hypothetical protein
VITAAFVEVRVGSKLVAVLTQRTHFTKPVRSPLPIMARCEPIVEVEAGKGSDASGPPPAATDFKLLKVKPSAAGPTPAWRGDRLIRR